MSDTNIFKATFQTEEAYRDLRKKVQFAYNALPTRLAAKQALSCLDLTSLKGDEDFNQILDLCDAAKASEVAAVCVSPNWVGVAQKAFQKVTGTRIATVINFPSGSLRTNTTKPTTPRTTMEDVLSAIEAGANQIDIVFPYQFFLDGQTERVRTILSACREACDKGVIMKVIMETAAYDNPADLARAVDLTLRVGADCIKTSTGKHKDGGATLEAVAIIMDRIKNYRDPDHKVIGIKISGGIKTVQDCARYIALQEMFFGSGSAHPGRFRIGGSTLFDTLHANLMIEPKQTI